MNKVTLMFGLLGMTALETDLVLKLKLLHGLWTQKSKNSVHCRPQLLVKALSCRDVQKPSPDKISFKMNSGKTVKLSCGQRIFIR